MTGHMEGHKRSSQQARGYMENKAQAQWSNRPQVKKDEDRVDNQKGGKAGEANKEERNASNHRRYTMKSNSKKRKEN